MRKYAELCKFEKANVVYKQVASMDCNLQTRVCSNVDPSEHETGLKSAIQTSPSDANLSRNDALYTTSTALCMIDHNLL